MPTISQLPLAIAVSAADEVLVSQGGAAKTITVGALLASTQPAITVDSPSLVGRISLGAGGPEQIHIGTGLSLSGRSLVADGRDHSGFSVVSTLPVSSDLVISNQGSPMLMQASLLRGLFSAGQNVVIDSNGVISTTTTGAGSGTVDVANSIGELRVVTGLAGQDLIGVSHAGSNCAIAYSNLLGGVTIDQASIAGPATDSDTIWVAQGTNVMASQAFNAIWVWIASKLPTYKTSVVEVTTDTNLDTTIHNGRLLVCSQPVTLSPLINNMGSGFQCVVINVSGGAVILGTGFVSSTGSLVLNSWQSATLSCATYSAGTIVFANMPTSASGIAIPGQVTGVSSISSTTTTINLSWLPPASGGVAASYVIRLRPSGTTSWATNAPVVNFTTCQLTALQPATSYDVTVEAQNAAGIGAPSAILTVVTSSAAQVTVPSQVIGLVASATSSSAIEINWSAQAGISAATSFMVQYKVTGTPGWTSSVAGMTATGGVISGLQAATSYDFSVFGVNNAGVGPSSSSVTASTQVASGGAISISWNLLPSGTFTRGFGTIPLNAHVSPPAFAIRFGFSISPTTPPASWTAGVAVNSSLWGAYAPTPATAGSWYAWAEGLDGSGPIVSPNPFLVQ